VKWLIRYLQNHTLEIFGFYRLAAGLILLLALLFL
jgi:undecaprenyl pyrophosphate phosphatase UppP